MDRRVAALFALSTTLAACANILGYDDLTTREESPTPVDSGSDSDSLVDTAPPPPSGVRPPGRPAGERKASGKGKTLFLLMNQIHVGTRTAGGEKVPNAWRDWGYDLDGVCTGPDEAPTSIGTCKRVESSEPLTNVDGNECRDNAFGAHLAPIADLAYGDDFDGHEAKAVARGDVTLLLVLDDLDDGADDPYVPGRMYKVARWTGIDPPTKDDIREVESDSVIADDLAAPRTAFPYGYLKGNVWVSGDPIASLGIAFPSSDLHLQIELSGGQLTLGLAANHSTGGVGLVTGAIPVARIDDMLRPLAALMGMCPGDPAYVAVLGNAKKIPDLVGDAPGLHDPKKPCDAISFTLGFGVVPILPVTTVVASPPPWIPPACDSGDAGNAG